MRSFLTVLLLFVLLLQTGCFKRTEEKPTKQEVHLFAKKILAQVDSMKIDFLKQNLIMEAFMNRVNISGKQEYLPEIKANVLLDLNSNEFERNIYNAMGADGTFELVKIFEKDNVHHAVFRLYSSAGINYFDMELTKLGSQVGIADIYVYMMGQNLSRTSAQYVEEMLRNSESSVGKVTNDRIKRIKSYRKSGHLKAAKKEFEMLPYGLRNIRVNEVIYLDILSKLSDTLYADHLHLLEQKYAGTPGLELMFMDSYILNKQYDKAFSALDSLDAALHHDPFLNYHRGLIHYIKADTKNAIAEYEKAAAEMPYFAPVRLQLASVYLEQNDELNARKNFSIYRKLPKADKTLVKQILLAYPRLKD